MEIIFTGRHQVVTDTVKSYLTDKVERVIKNIPKVNSIHAILDSERFQHKVEVLINLNHMHVRAADKSDDMLASVDNVIDKLQRQLKKYKDKLQYHRTKEKDKEFRLPKESKDDTDDGEDFSNFPQLVRAKKLAPKPMDEDEAMMQLKLSEDSFLVFLNSETEEVNVVYKKKDGNFGLIEPQRKAKKA